MKITQKISGLVLAALIAAGAMAAAPALAADRVIKVGTLKLIHAITPYFYEKFTPAGYKIEVIPYETPTDGKNAVVTRSVDFGTYGIAAATLGGAAGEPVVIIGAQCNRGMAVVAGAKSDIKSIKDLKGKKVAIWPGSTQEVVILDRLQNGRDVDQGHPADPRVVQRHAGSARTRRHRRLRRRRAGPVDQRRQRRRQDRRVSL